MLNFFSFDCELMVSYEKTTGFGDKAHLHISPMFSSLVVSLLTEIRYFQSKPSVKGTHNNENMMLKMFCMRGFVR